MPCDSRIDDAGDSFGVFMSLRDITTDEKFNGSPLGRGKGRQALGWVVE